MRHFGSLDGLMVACACLLMLWLAAPYGEGWAADAPPQSPVFIGYDAEAGHKTSTSDDAIRIGILAAMDEINASGGVLGGRRLELIEKDHRSVPARGVKNIREFAAIEDLVAVVGGKFSPVMIEELDAIHETGVILMDVWGAADVITDHGRVPNYCFRVSLKDSWAMEAMMDHAKGRGFTRVGLMLPVTAWGRSNEQAVNQYLARHPETTLTSTQWYNWGEKSMIGKHEAILASGAQAVILVANEGEGSLLVREMAALDRASRLPLISHWGITGGDFARLTGPAIEDVDISVVQTYSFFDRARPRQLARFYETAGRLFGIEGPEDIPSPVGVAHAYDATHILALAIDLAGTTDRAAVRDALERVRNYDGLIKRFERPFTPSNHTALLPGDLFMGRFRPEDGAVLRISP